MNHVVDDVPGLGRVVVGRHAQQKCAQHHVTEEAFVRALREGQSVPDGPTVVWRQLGDLRVVVNTRPRHSAALRWSSRSTA